MMKSLKWQGLAVGVLILIVICLMLLQQRYVCGMCVATCLHSSLSPSLSLYCTHFTGQVILISLCPSLQQVNKRIFIQKHITSKSQT